MAQASKRLRQLRRLKRERTLLYRMVDHLSRQRDEARFVANAMAKEIENRVKEATAPEATINVVEETENNVETLG